MSFIHLPFMGVIMQYLIFNSVLFCSPFSFHMSSSPLSPQLSCMIWAPRLIRSPALRAAWPPIAAVSTWAIRPAATGVAVTASGAPSAASACRDTRATSVRRVSQSYCLTYSTHHHVIPSTTKSSMCSGKIIKKINCKLIFVIWICKFTDHVIIRHKISAASPEQITFLAIVSTT